MHNICEVRDRVISCKNSFWGSRFMKSKVRFNKNMILRLVLIGIVLYVVFLFVNLFAKIMDKRREIENTKSQISQQQNEINAKSEILEKNSSESDQSQSGDECQKNTRIYENVVK